MSKHTITTPLSIEFLGVARSGKSTTTRAFLLALKENGFDFIDFSEFQQTEKSEKYKLLVFSLIKNFKFEDMLFLGRYTKFFLKTLLYPDTKLDRVRILHPLKYYIITNYLLSVQPIAIVEDGATHISSGYQKVYCDLHKAMVGSKSVLVVVNDIPLDDAIARVEADNPKNIPWVVKNREELYAKYKHYNDNKNKLLDSLSENFKNVVILRIDATEPIEKKVAILIQFLTNNSYLK
jgi:thymidylate kinase